MAPRDEQLATLAELFAGRFTVREKLNWGGLALYYGGSTLHGELALAVLPLDCESQPENSRLFYRAMEEIKGIEAATIVRILEAGVQHGVPFVAYDRVPGAPLGDTLADEGAIEPRRALHIARRVLEALQVIHGSGAFHGDLTPSNVLLSDQAVSIIGVGIAAILRRAAPSDRTGPTGRGSGPSAIRYLAPEILGGARGSAEADLYSVGALLHHMISGFAPGKGEPPPGSFERVPGLLDVVRKAMKHAPGERFKSADEMREALALEVLETPAQATLPPPREETPLWNVTPPSKVEADEPSARARWWRRGEQSFPRGPRTVPAIREPFTACVGVQHRLVRLLLTRRRPVRGLGECLATLAQVTALP